MFTSQIRHPPNASFVQIHEWQLEATGGDRTASALLSVFEHRHNALVVNRNFDILVRNAADAAGFVLPPDFEYWFSFTDAQLVYRVKIAKKETIYKAIDKLCSINFIRTDAPAELIELVRTGRRKWFQMNIAKINLFTNIYTARNSNEPDHAHWQEKPTTRNAEAKTTAINPQWTQIATEVFDDWKTLHESPRSTLDDKRRKLIYKLLKNGVTKDRMMLATRGILTIDHNMGINDRQTMYNQFELIFRDIAHVEKYEAAAIEIGIKESNFRNYEISKSDRVFRKRQK